MKACKKCGKPKPESEYYRKFENKDGLDAWCKVCRNEDNKRYKGTVHKTAESTQRVMDLLTAKGIPYTTGYHAGKPGKDIVAYGMVKIEAKSAQPGIVSNCGTEHYCFGFTKRQLQLDDDFYILIMHGGQRDRVFVVPASEIKLDGQKLVMSLYCPNRPGKNSHLSKYEDAFHLISEYARAKIDNIHVPDNRNYQNHEGIKGNKRKQRIQYTQPAQIAFMF